MKTAGTVSRRYWLWVARPDVYLDEDGMDRADLDPSNYVDSDGWWTCHKDTHRGDLVLLWRTRPKSDIGYLIQVESDAYSIRDNEYAASNNWDYGCDYKVLFKFRKPITISELRSDPFFSGWGPLKRSFQGRVFEIEPPEWRKLNEMAFQRDRKYAPLINELEHLPIAREISSEDEYEEALMHDLGKLSKFGFDLELYVDPATRKTGRQFICQGHGGRIDLLCYDRKGKRFVVIELKIVQAGQNTIGQVITYMGWVQDKIAGGKPVVGLVISRGSDIKFQSSLKALGDNVKHLNLDQLGLK